MTRRRNFVEPHHAEYPGRIRLTLSDISDLITLLRDNSGQLTITQGKDGEWAIEEVGDLAGLKAKEILPLAFITKEPETRTILEETRTQVTTSEDSKNARRLVHNVCQTLRERRSVRPKVQLSIVSIILLLGLLITMASEESSALRASWMLIAGGALVSVYATNRHLEKQGEVKLSIRSATQNRALKDQVILAIFAALAGSLTTLLAQFLTNYITM